MRALAAIFAMLLTIGTPAGLVAAPLDCGGAPSVACLSAAVFALAKTLPEKNDTRRSVDFAERELAPGDLKTAMDYVIADAPDNPPWDDIAWRAIAGRFDRAIALAKQRETAVERVGGLISVADAMLNRNRRSAAEKIIDSVEGELASISPEAGGDYGSILPGMAAEIRVRLGQPERAARLLADSGYSSVSNALGLARKYPAALRLRELAWRHAEQRDEYVIWSAVLEDSIMRGDKTDIARAAERASAKVENRFAIQLAHRILKAGLPELAARVVPRWPDIVNEQTGKQRIYEACYLLIKVLVDLARDSDVEAAVNSVSDVGDRSRCLSKAASEYHAAGRTDLVRKFDAEALQILPASPKGDRKLPSEQSVPLNNLAIDRAGRGDFAGAFEAAARLRSETKIHQVTFFMIRHAIDNGRKGDVAPVISILEQQAMAVGDVTMLLDAVRYRYQIGTKDEARQALERLLTLRATGQLAFAPFQLGTAAELRWQFDGGGKGETMLAIVDELGVRDSHALDRLVEIVRPVSPSVAVQLTDRESDAERRINGLANIAIQIATTRK